MSILKKLRDTFFESSFSNGVVEYLVDSIEHDEATLLETDVKLLDVYQLVKKRLGIPSWRIGTRGEEEEMIIVHSHLDVELLSDVVNMPKVRRVIYVVRHPSPRDSERIQEICTLGKGGVRVTYGYPA